MVQTSRMVPATAPATREVLLAARGIRKSFQIGTQKLEVLHGVDLELARGELLALMGSSGAGKSTLLHILGLLDPPTEGDVMLGGASAWKLPVEERAKLRNQKIGFVFQFYHLLPELNAPGEQFSPAMITWSALEYRGKKKEFCRARREHGVLRLTERLKHRPAQLGGKSASASRSRAPCSICRSRSRTSRRHDSATGEKVLELLLEEQARQYSPCSSPTTNASRTAAAAWWATDGRINAEAGSSRRPCRADLKCGSH